MMQGSCTGSISPCIRSLRLLAAFASEARRPSVANAPPRNARRANATSVPTVALPLNINQTIGMLAARHREVQDRNRYRFSNFRLVERDTCRRRGFWPLLDRRVHDREPDQFGHRNARSFRILCRNGVVDT